MQSQQRKSYMELQQLELEININIGPNQHFVLQVPKHSNLSQVVHQFLKERRLSLNYHNSILHLVKKELQKRALILNTQNTGIRNSRNKIWNEKNQSHQQKTQYSQAKSIGHKQNIKEKNTNNQQQNYQRSNNKMKGLQQTSVQTQQQNQQPNSGLNTFNQLKKIKQEIQIKKQNARNLIRETSIKDFQKYSQRNQTNRTHLQREFQDISIAHYQQQQLKRQKSEVEQAYESWKKMQKNKQNDTKSKTPRKSMQLKTQNAVLKGNKTPQMKDKLLTQNKTLIDHQKTKKHQLSPTYFYKRGIVLQKLKEEEQSRKFKQIYPFQINQNLHLSEKDKQKLHLRLFKEAQVKKLKTIENQVRHQTRSPHFQYHSKSKASQSDPYKEKVTQKRLIIDKILTQCIQQKKVGQGSQIRSVSKSPFRKTIIF